MSEHREGEHMIEVGGQQYLVQRVTARMKYVREDQLPKQVIEHVKATASTIHWNDGANPDLVHVQFLLDAEGSNNNWDYLPRPQLVKSHATAIFKPIDMDHIIKEKSSMVYMDPQQPPVRNTICGVMTNTALAWAKSGELLSEKEIKDLDNIDDMSRGDDRKLGVVAWGALYRFLFPKTVASLIDKINDGDMQVSMERWIGQWDYLVYDPASASYKSVSRADGAEDGTHSKWATHQMIGGKPVYRRSLAYVYGGVANTSNPAQKLSRFLDPNEILKATASTSPATRLAIEQLQRVHDQLHAEFLVSASAADKQRMIAEHERVTRAIATMLGISGKK